MCYFACTKPDKFLERPANRIQSWNRRLKNEMHSMKSKVFTLTSQFYRICIIVTFACIDIFINVRRFVTISSDVSWHLTDDCSILYSPKLLYNCTFPSFAVLCNYSVRKLVYTVSLTLVIYVSLSFDRRFYQQSIVRAWNASPEKANQI